ncbi:hypothetical protein N9L49_01855 [Rhodospirillales bacterium]|nr:hypothetical protein [Rhodospirillales bacterium]
MRLVILTIGLAGTAAIVALLATITYALHDADTVTADTLVSFTAKQLRTEVSVGETPISLKSGTTQIIGLKIANPPGFSNANAIHGPEIIVDIDVSRSTPSTIFIRKMTIQRPDVLLEINEGQANLVRLMQALKAAPLDMADEQELNVMAAEIWLVEGQLSILIDSLGDTPVETPLPDTRLKDIGVAENGISSAAFLDTLTTLIIKSSERATRRIDIAAIASERGVPIPDIDFKSLLTE